MHSLYLDCRTFKNLPCEVCCVSLQDIVEVVAHYITECPLTWMQVSNFFLVLG